MSESELSVILETVVVSVRVQFLLKSFFQHTPVSLAVILAGERERDTQLNLLQLYT